MRRSCCHRPCSLLQCGPQPYTAPERAALAEHAAHAKRAAAKRDAAKERAAAADRAATAERADRAKRAAATERAAVAERVATAATAERTAAAAPVPMMPMLPQPTDPQALRESDFDKLWSWRRPDTGNKLDPLSQAFDMRALSARRRGIARFMDGVSDIRALRDQGLRAGIIPRFDLSLSDAFFEALWRLRRPDSSCVVDPFSQAYNNQCMGLYLDVKEEMQGVYNRLRESKRGVWARVAEPEVETYHPHGVRAIAIATTTTTTMPHMQR